MPYVLLVLALLVVVAAGARAFAGEPARPKPAGEAPAPKEKGMARLTRDELRARLEKLAATNPSPAEFSPGAECYKVARAPDTADYVCPVCGARTHYADDMLTAELIRDLPDLRKLAAGIPDLDLSLDERPLCRKCTPKAPATPRVDLVVKTSDGVVTRAEGVTDTDLTLLREFLDGKVKHRGPQDRETALKDALPRIRELLGASGAAPKSP